MILQKRKNRMMMTHISQNLFKPLKQLSYLKNNMIIIGAIIGFLSYTAPYLFGAGHIFFDHMYAIGTLLGFGIVLAGLSLKLKTKKDFICSSISIFFISLSITFLLNTLFNNFFRTNYLVLFNIIISFICICILLIRKRRQQ